MNRTNLDVTTFSTPFPIDQLRAVLRKRKGLRGVINGTRTIYSYTNAIFKDQAAISKLQVFKADLVVGDAAIPTGYALADLLHIPKGALLIGGLLPPLDADYGLSAANNLARVPQMNSGFSSNMSFWQRVQNVAIWAASTLMIRFIFNPIFSSAWVQNNVPPHNARTSLESVCVVIVSDDFAIASSRPISPHVAVVGALTAAPAKQLGAELEEYLQSAGQHGLVYASFGTTAVPEPHELRGVAAALAALAPRKALWKLTASEQSNLHKLGICLGDNVRAVAWVPQNDLLGHPNVGAFLTQGGSNSVLEAMYHGVPLVGLPLLAEQPGNIAKVAHAGAGIAVSPLDRPSLAADLEAALLAVLSNVTYRRAAAAVAARMQTRRRRPAELAADALEHAAWMHGSPYLRDLARLTQDKNSCRSLVAGFQAELLKPPTCCSPRAGFADKTPPSRDSQGGKNDMGSQAGLQKQSPPQRLMEVDTQVPNSEAPEWVPRQVPLQKDGQPYPDPLESEMSVGEVVQKGSRRPHVAGNRDPSADPAGSPWSK
ncbi:hypothetical protein WJX72_000738 [[Myrmecia] bisecta]|uniref:Glycosyltransferase n=1 Tax=[Myrmecia] bisecta TaxID=41462 RepID=A0AAW1P629_9CHLO